MEQRKRKTETEILDLEIVDRKDNKLEIFFYRKDNTHKLVYIDEDEINFNEIIHYCDGDNDILDKEKYEFIEFFWDLFIDKKCSFDRIYNIRSETFYVVDGIYMEKEWNYYCENFDKKFKKFHIERYKEFYIEKNKDSFVEFVVIKRVCDYLKLDIYDYFCKNKEIFNFYEKLKLNKPESRLKKMTLVKRKLYEPESRLKKMTLD